MPLKTGITTSEGFRDVIKEMGEEIKINETPINLLKKLNAVGLNLSYSSPGEAVLEEVNEGLKNHKITLKYSTKTNVSNSPIDSIEYEPALYIPIAGLVPSLDYFSESSISGEVSYILKNSSDVVITIEDKIMKTTGLRIHLYDNEVSGEVVPVLKFGNGSTSSISSIVSDNGGTLVGINISIYFPEGAFYTGSDDKKLISDEFTYSFTYGDTIFGSRYAELPVPLSNEAEIISMSVDYVGDAWVDSGTTECGIDLPVGYNSIPNASKILNFTVSDGATLSYNGTELVDGNSFSALGYDNVYTLTVTAEDGVTTKEWTFNTYGVTTGGIFTGVGYADNLDQSTSDFNILYNSIVNGNSVNIKTMIGGEENEYSEPTVEGNNTIILSDDGGSSGIRIVRGESSLSAETFEQELNHNNKLSFFRVGDASTNDIYPIGTASEFDLILPVGHNEYSNTTIYTDEKTLSFQFENDSSGAKLYYDGNELTSFDGVNKQNSIANWVSYPGTYELTAVAEDGVTSRNYTMRATTDGTTEALLTYSNEQTGLLAQGASVYDEMYAIRDSLEYIKLNDPNSTYPKQFYQDCFSFVTHSSYGNCIELYDDSVDPFTESPTIYIHKDGNNLVATKGDDISSLDNITVNRQIGNTTKSGYDFTLTIPYGWNEMSDSLRTAGAVASNVEIVEVNGTNIFEEEGLVLVENEENGNSVIATRDLMHPGSMDYSLTATVSDSEFIMGLGEDSTAQELADFYGPGLSSYADFIESVQGTAKGTIIIGSDVYYGDAYVDDNTQDGTSIRVVADDATVYVTRTVMYEEDPETGEQVEIGEDYFCDVVPVEGNE